MFVRHTLDANYPKYIYSAIRQVFTNRQLAYYIQQNEITICQIPHMIQILCIFSLRKSNVSFQPSGPCKLGMFGVYLNGIFVFLLVKMAFYKGNSITTDIMEHVYMKD